MKRLDLTGIARADLDAVQRYSLRTWGETQTAHYVGALRDTLKALTRGAAVAPKGALAENEGRRPHPAEAWPDSPRGVALV